MLIVSSLKAKLWKYAMFGNTLHLQTVELFAFFDRIMITEVNLKKGIL